MESLQVAVIFLTISAGHATDFPIGSQLVSSEIACSISAECDFLAHNESCFETPLPYNSVSFAYTGLQNIWNTKDELEKWSALRSVPKCWAVVQPLLCAVYLPKCENGILEKVSHQLCKVAQNPCRFVAKTKGWPAFLNCNNATVFTPSSNECESAAAETSNNGPRKFLNKFNSTGNCLEPFFKRTKEPSAYYMDIDECGLSCKNPLYTNDEQLWLGNWIKILFAIGVTFGLFLSLTLVARYYFKNPKASSTEHVLNHILLWMQVCYTMVCIGVLFQFTTDVICREDGTKPMPNASQSSSCSFVFVLLYCGDFAFTIWLIFFMYVFSISIKTSNTVKENLSQRKNYLHMIAWIISGVFTLTALFVNAIDGFSLSGVCQISLHYRSLESGPVADMTFISAFILFPQCVLLAICCVVCGKLFYDLRNLSKNTPSGNAGPIRKKEFRVGFCIIPTIIAKFVRILLHVYAATSTHAWDQSQMEYLYCQIWQKDCHVSSRQNLNTVLLDMICLFLPGFLTIILIYDQLKPTWRECVCQLFQYLTQPRNQSKNQQNGDKSQHPKIPKHEVVRKAYAKRHEFEETGRLSVSIDNEPSLVPRIGIDSKLQNVSESSEFSADFVNALPRLMFRRNALDGTELKVSLRKAPSMDSIASRASSIRIKKSSWVYEHSIAGDSQYSLQQSELDHLENLYQSAKKKGRSKRNPFKRHKRLRRSISSRQSSFTSQDTNNSLGSAITLDPRQLQAAFQNIEKKPTDYIELKQKFARLHQESDQDQAVQTSLTDLSRLGKRPPMQDAGIQCCIVAPPSTDTTTSSSQTEVKSLLYPVEAHVTQIRVHHEGGSSTGDSSSILSSFDRDFEKLKTTLPKLAVPQHNRGRRGGIVDINTVALGVNLEEDFDELELHHT